MLNVIKPNVRSLNLLSNICKVLNNGSVVRLQACNLHFNATSRLPLVFEKDLSSSLSNTCIVAKRWYAKKGKESKDKKGKPAPTKLDLNDPSVNEVLNVEKLNSQMDSVLKQLQKELADQLTLRVTLETVGDVVVETDEGTYKLCDIAQIQQKSPQLIAVHINGCPQNTSKVHAAIIKSGINVTPQMEGTSLFLPIQKVTREHREKLSKSAKSICEKYKDKLRDVQNSHIKSIKSHKATHSEDLLKQVSEYVANQNKVYTAKAEEMLAIRQKEIMNN